MTLRPLSSILLMLCALASFQLAPDRANAQEIQVAFDSFDDSLGTGKLLTINRQLRDQLGVFPDYPQFEQARLYRLSANQYTLEIAFEENGRGTRKVFTLDSLQTAELRADIRKRISREQPRAMIDQSGRSHFLWTTAIASFLYYGPAITNSVGSTSAGTATTTYLVAGGAGFFIPYFLTLNSTMTDGMAAAARVGAVLGVAHTLLGYGIVLDFDSDDDLFRSFTAVSTGVSIAEMSMGLALARKYNVSAGRANLIGVGGIFGAGIGLETSLLVFGTNIDAGPAAMAGFGLAGSLGGMYAANQIALNTNYTTGDAKAMMMGGLVGSALAGSIVANVNGSTEVRLLTALLIAGTGLGCYATHQWLGARDFDDSDGNLTILGTLGGALIGGGLAFATEGSTAFVATAVGAAAGFSVMMATLGRNNSGMGYIEPDGSGIEFNVNPVGLGMAAGKIDMPVSSRRPSLFDKPLSVPVANLSFRF